VNPQVGADLNRAITLVRDDARFTAHDEKTAAAAAIG
jgi:hypothetical protein